MFTEIFIVLGVIFLLSLLGYLIPQLIVWFTKPLDLKTRYGGGWAFITGGNSGIGEAFAKKVAKMGFNVAIVARDEDRLKKVEIELKEINPEIKTLAIKADLSGDPVQVTEQIVQQLEGLDISILYFNAGQGAMEKITNPTEKSLIMFRSNIVTHQYLFQQLYPKLANRQLSDSKRRGAVLFTSSGLAIFVSPGAVLYAATKAYMGHFGECLATEAEQFGIDVISIYPGMVNTRLGKREQEMKIPPLLEKLMQSADFVANLALSGLGRVTRVDCGFSGIIARIITKVIDNNLFIKIIQIASSGKKKEKKND
ncbi:MAG: putative 17 beta-hydroxysteroid dehydrogenase type 3 [Streblomastix strix]|uniref:Putative 17 beta-hydroxysteroid dehydrogenase type 3 n=1 Tax=Streblomastix strix TaxID=222440 RepID=A0A5J4WB58_9EUKA|nr:MAG: putative 17 beta-hydroxysteroid dehydrogenase type 3 [Streblomastix strix]